jgi:DNA-directed RNA polymerase specialized sigma24 family protein
MQNRYGQLVEPWKVNIVIVQARKKGFRDDEMDDALQEIIPAMMAFRFDPSRSNGATKRTALTALVNNRLTFIQRGRARRTRHHERYMEHIGFTGETKIQEVPDKVTPDDVVLAIDVQDAVAGLPTQEQAVCEALARGDKHLSIAKSMGIPPCRVNRMIGCIRKRFSVAGLNAWGG